jgi:hypothetical protein
VAERDHIVGIAYDHRRSRFGLPGIPTAVPRS